MFSCNFPTFLPLLYWFFHFLFIAYTSIDPPFNTRSRILIINNYVCVPPLPCPWASHNPGFYFSFPWNSLILFDILLQSIFSCFPKTYEKRVSYTFPLWDLVVDRGDPSITLYAATVQSLYPTEEVHHRLYYPVDGHLSRFSILATTNTVALNFLGHVVWYTYETFSWRGI